MNDSTLTAGERELLYHRFVIARELAAVASALGSGYVTAEVPIDGDSLWFTCIGDQVWLSGSRFDCELTHLPEWCLFAEARC